MNLKSIISTMCLGLCTLAVSAQKKPNVLFIAVDDLNDWIGCLGGHPQAITPNIDKLAKEGLLFTNAHCQAPICGPSRASVMTGLAPTTTGIYLQAHDPNIKKANEAASKAIFLPDWFEEHGGYKTMAAGKVFHNGDKAKSFDVYENTGGSPKPKKRMKWPPAKGFPKKGTGTDWGALGEDAEYKDFRTAAFGVEMLKKKHNKPFFLGVGFVRPHVPWYVPQKWFDMHPIKDIKSPPYKADDFDDIPEMAKQVMDIPPMPTTEWAIENGEWKNIVQAYLACVTFVDAQIGKVLDALRESEYADNTIVVLWSDHGYHVGEKNRFAKQSTWERSTRNILLIKAPGKAEGIKTDAPAQLLDMYPTLLELCDLPANPQNEGNSLVPLLDNPKTKWDHLALTSFGQGNVSMRSRTHRYIVYEDGSEELYDMVNDPNEWTNLAKNPEYKAMKEQFKRSIPEKQAPLSVVSRYRKNAYFTKKTVESQRRDRAEKAHAKKKK